LESWIDPCDKDRGIDAVRQEKKSMNPAIATFKRKVSVEDLIMRIIGRKTVREEGVGLGRKKTCGSAPGTQIVNKPPPGT